MLNIPCDYDGYDLRFKKGETDPNLYSEFNNLITNNKYSINEIEEYNNLTKESDNDYFNKFYDIWIKSLIDNNFVISLDNNISINTFSTSINNILIARGEKAKINVNEVIEKYNNELKKYVFNNNKITDTMNYDILEANVVATELRKIGYELICLFNGYDNNIKAVIKIEDINKAKDIEEKI